MPFPLYKHIPGDIDKVVQGGRYSIREKALAAEKLCNEYLSIIGGKSVSAQINRKMKC